MVAFKNKINQKTEDIAKADKMILANNALKNRLIHQRKDVKSMVVKCDSWKHNVEALIQSIEV